MKKLLLKNVWQTLAAVVFLIAVWFVAYLAVGNELLVPDFKDSLKEMGSLLVSAWFWKGWALTMLRVALAFVLSFAVALPCAVIAYLRPTVGAFFAPIVSALRSLPVLAVLLILLSFLSAGFAPVAVAFLSLFPLLYTGILAALSGIDRHLIEASRVCGATWYTRVWRVYLPLSSSYVLREAGGALSFALKLVVSAEVLAQTARSLGGMMQSAKVYGEIPQLFALVCVSFVAGLILELSMNALALHAEKKIR